MFKKNDVVVHPSWVLCKIKELTKIEDKNEPVYVLKPCYIKDVGNFKIMVTKEQATELGLRHPVKESAIPNVFDVLKDNDESNAPDTKNISEFLRNKISKNDLKSSAEILRDTKFNGNWQWNVTYKTYVDNARKRLVDEIAYVKGVSRTEVNKSIDSALESRC